MHTTERDDFGLKSDNCGPERADFGTKRTDYGTKRTEFGPERAVQRTYRQTYVRTDGHQGIHPCVL